MSADFLTASHELNVISKVFPVDRTNQVDPLRSGRHASGGDHSQSRRCMGVTVVSASQKGSDLSGTNQIEKADNGNGPPPESRQKRKRREQTAMAQIRIKFIPPLRRVRANIADKILKTSWTAINIFGFGIPIAFFLATVIRDLFARKTGVAMITVFRDAFFSWPTLTSIALTGLAWAYLFVLSYRMTIRDDEARLLELLVDRDDKIANQTRVIGEKAQDVLNTLETFLKTKEELVSVRESLIQAQATAQANINAFRDQYAKTSELEAKYKELESRIYDGAPKLVLKAYYIADPSKQPKQWAIHVENCGQRAARFIRLRPEQSYSGKFTLHFSQLPTLRPDSEQAITFWVTEGFESEVPLVSFLNDHSPDAALIWWDIRITFRDMDESTTEEIVRLCYDVQYDVLYGTDAPYTERGFKHRDSKAGDSEDKPNRP
ncbi:MAG TPA: hypothetical protein VI685_00815 [Candidatus Angelobacter sp.]